MLEKMERMACLFDFYGPLLTDRQQRIMELHYENDWSLGEIAAEFGVSRQAIYDILKRAEKALEHYEERLGLVGKFSTERQQLTEVYRLLRDMDVLDDNKKKRALTLLQEVLGMADNRGEG